MILTPTTVRRCQYEPCGREIQVNWCDTMARYQKRKYCSIKCAGAVRRTFIEHGTVGGYQRCRRRPEGACDACKAGQTKDWKERQTHRRAVAALIELHPDEYRRLRGQLANLSRPV